MLLDKESLEKKDGKVVLKLEDDNVTSEVIDHFLMFLYSGKLKDIRKFETSAEFVWVDLLPQLVNLAQKVSNQSVNL